MNLRLLRSARPFLAVAIVFFATACNPSCPTCLPSPPDGEVPCLCITRINDAGTVSRCGPGSELEALAASGDSFPCDEVPRGDDVEWSCEFLSEDESGCFVLVNVDLAGTVTSQEVDLVGTYSHTPRADGCGLYEEGTLVIRSDLDQSCEQNPESPGAESWVVVRGPGGERRFGVEGRAEGVLRNRPTELDLTGSLDGVLIDVRFSHPEGFENGRTYSLGGYLPAEGEMWSHYDETKGTCFFNLLDMSGSLTITSLTSETMTGLFEFDGEDLMQCYGGSTSDESRRVTGEFSVPLGTLTSRSERFE